MSNENKYDLVMFGATGFTGKLVCEYINSKYSDSLNWAIAGRNKDKLENVSNELGLSVPTIELDSNNCLLYTSPSPRDYAASRMPSSA